MVRSKRTRGVPYLDSVDLQILEVLDNPDNFHMPEGMAVLKLVEKMNINHNSLKPHIDKLINLNLICIINWSEGIAKDIHKLGLVSIKARNEYILKTYNHFSDQQIYEAKKDIGYFNSVIELLRDIKKYYTDREYLDLEIDLRNKKKMQKHFLKNWKK